MRLLRTLLITLALTTMPIAAHAQTPPPSPDEVAPPAPAALPAAPPALPPGYAPPPAGYALPPSGYAPLPAGYAPPPGAYVYPPSYSPAPGYFGPEQVATRPEVLPYKRGTPVPEGYHRDARIRTGLVIAGAVTFAVSYALSVTAAVGSREGTMAVPIAGPFIALGRLHFGDTGLGDGGLLSGFGAVVLILDGVLQAGGAGMLIAGLAAKKQVLVRDDVAPNAVRVVPMTMGYGGTGLGIGIVGSM